MGLHLRSHNYTGKFEQTVRMTTNDPEHPFAAVVCHGRVNAAMHLETKKIAFGNVKDSGGPAYKTLVVRRGDGPPINPVVSTQHHHGLATQVCEIEPGEHYEIEMSIGSPWPDGYFRYNVLIEPGIEGMPGEMVYVLGTVSKRLTSIPTQYLVLPNRVRDTLHTVRLHWTDAQPAEVVSADTTIEGATVEVTKQRNYQMVRLSVPKDAIVSENDIVALTFKDSEVSQYEIPITTSRGLEERRRIQREQARRHRISKSNRPTPVGKPRPVAQPKSGD